MTVLLLFNSIKKTRFEIDDKVITKPYSIYRVPLESLLIKKYIFLIANIKNSILKNH